MPDIIISLTPAQATRVQAAFVKQSGNPDYGLPDLKQFLIAQIRAVVVAEERKEAEAAVVVAPLDPT